MLHVVRVNRVLFEFTGWPTQPQLAGVGAVQQRQEGAVRQRQLQVAVPKRRMLPSEPRALKTENAALKAENAALKAENAALRFLHLRWMYDATIEK